MIDSTVSAFRITRTSLLCLSNHLPPFAMYAAFPCADYYGGSVPICVAARRASRVPAPHHVRAPRRYATHPFVHAHCVLVRMPKGVPAETCCENRMRHWFQACFQWAVTTPRRDWRSSNPAFTIGRGSCRASYPPCLRITPAFPACCIPVSVSTSGRLGDPLTSFRVNSACGGDGVACDTAHGFGQMDLVANPVGLALGGVTRVNIVWRANVPAGGGVSSLVRQRKRSFTVTKF